MLFKTLIFTFDKKKYKTLIILIRLELYRALSFRIRAIVDSWKELGYSKKRIQLILGVGNLDILWKLDKLIRLANAIDIAFTRVHFVLLEEQWDNVVPLADCDSFGFTPSGWSFGLTSSEFFLISALPKQNRVYSSWCIAPVILCAQHALWCNLSYQNSGGEEQNWHVRASVKVF